jgi:hypothetical protein
MITVNAKPESRKLRVLKRNMLYLKHFKRLPMVGWANPPLYPTPFQRRIQR